MVNIEVKHYALIVKIIDDMNKEIHSSVLQNHMTELMKNLSLLNKLLKAAELEYLDYNLAEIKRYCLQKIEGEDIQNGFKNIPIHSAEEKAIIEKDL